MGAIASLWLSLLCLSVSWLCAVPLYEPAKPLSWALLAVAAVASSAWAFREVRVRASWRFFAVVGVPAAIATAFVPAPYSFGPALLAAGCLLAAAGMRSGGGLGDGVTSAAAGVAFAGLVASVQALAIAPYVALTSRYPEPGFLGVVTGPVLRLLGVHARSGAEGLLIDTGVRTVTYSLTWSAFGAFVAFLFVVGAVPVLLVARRRWAAFPALLILVWAYAEVRFALVVLMLATSARLDVLWSVPVTLLTFLPLAAVASVLLPSAPAPAIELPDPPVRGRAFALAAALVCVAVVALAGSIAFEEPGARKAGRVIVDEGHSDWEWTAKPLDTEWFGEKSGYNYYSLYQYLDHFYRMSRNAKPITARLLADCDVLVIKMPTTAFRPEEIDAVVEFVRDGGGLFLIGDHTNVFGTSVNINPLADRFGMRFEPVAEYDLSSGRLSEYHRPGLLPHPIVQNLPPTFLFATSSTLKLAPGTRAAIVGYGLRSMKADYAEQNFFPSSDAARLPEMRFGPMIQGATKRFGRGRAAAFADSTVFSNFWVFVPGKPELALSYVEWLDRTNGPVDPRPLLAVLALASAAGAGFVLRREGARTLALAVCVGVLVGIPAGTHLWGALNRASYGLPAARSAYTGIGFEREYSRFTSPANVEGFYASTQDSLHTFYMWTQRLGYVPSLHDSLEGALATDDLVVVANPSGTPSREDVAAVSAFVERGGRLFVMASSSDGTSSAGAFLEPFGLRVERGPLRRGVYTPRGGDPLTFTAGAGRVSGGTPLVSIDSSEVVCAYVRKGRGIVAAFSDPALFASASMGNENVVPDGRQREIGNLEFSLMRFLAKDEKSGF